jgi:putative flippase GtrA
MSAALQSLMRTADYESGSTSPLAGLMRFVGIGALGALAFVVLSSIIIGMRTGFENWMVNTACYAALIGPVYLLHRRFSFQSNAAHRRALPRYLTVQGMALLLAALFSYVAHGVFMLPTLAASLVVIALTASINFVILRTWAFARGGLAAAIS